jgi:hypothetical protein
MYASERAFARTPISFPHPMLGRIQTDSEPSILLYDTDEEVVGSICFPANRFSSATLERFGRHFTAFMETLLRRPQARVRDIIIES